MRRRLARLLAVLGTAGALSVLLAGPAAAHNSLVSVDPADGSTVAATPAAVVLTFDEPAVALGTQVVVTGPQGRANAGAARLVDDTVRQEIGRDAPAGRYTVAWRVTSADGHPVTGELSFTSTAAGGGSAPADPAPEPGSAGTGPGLPVWAWVAVAVVLVGAAATIGAQLNRRRLQEGGRADDPAGSGPS